MRVTVEVSPEFKEVFDKVDKKLFTAVKMGLADTAYAVEGEAKQRAPVDVGILRSKIRTKSEGELTWFVGTEVSYARNLEEGGPPRVVPVESLIDWVRRKRGIFGISTPAEITSMAYAVKHSIARKGTKKQPFLIPAWEKVKSTIGERIKRFIKK